MDHSFKAIFESICKIQRKWDNIKIVLKSNHQSTNYQVNSIGPFAYFSKAKSNKYDFILFMPDFSPLNQSTNTIILQPSNSDINNLHYTLTFNNENSMNDFQKYWYDSIILVEDMLRSIILKKHTQSEKILTYNRTAKTFQEVVCVIQAISSSMVVFQTQFFNKVSMVPGVSIQIDKKFVSMIVSPLNTFIPKEKKLFSFYIESINNNKHKLYFVCPNKESLMNWILILHGLACQTKYKENVIDEENRFTNLIDKINKMIGDDIKDRSVLDVQIKKKEEEEEEEEEINEKEENVGVTDCEGDKIELLNKHEDIQGNNSISYSKIMIVFLVIFAFLYFKSFFKKAI